MRCRFLAAVLLVLLGGRALAAHEPRPNMIVILVDDLGFSDVGCYGSEIPTPHLDALAANGLRFKQFYNNARCCPTRATLLTGLYPHQAGIGHMAGPDQGLPGYLGHLSPRCVTAAQLLQPAGYFTAMVGKWHVGNEPGSNPWERGFSRSLNAVAGGFYFPDSPKAKLFLNGQSVAARGGPLPNDWYSTDLWTSQALRFVDEARAEGKPFYVYLAHNAPHFPLQAPAEEIAKFRGRYRAGWGALCDERLARQVASGLIDSAWEKAPRPAAIRLWRDHSPEEQDRFDHLMAVYAATVHRIDRAVGDLVGGLRERGVLENTLILFLSDNGGNAESGPMGRTVGDPSQADSNWFCGESWAFLQNTPLRRYKHYVHEGGIASPLIAHWPAGIQGAGAWRNDPTHVIDVVPTLLDVAGVAYPRQAGDLVLPPLEGTSWKPLFAATPAALPERALFWEHEGNAAVRLGDLKLVRLGSEGPWELYDLRVDRTEQHDLAASQPDKVRELAALWQAWAERAHVLPRPENAPAAAGPPAPKTRRRKAAAPAASTTPSAATETPPDTRRLFEPTPEAARDPRVPLPPATLADCEQQVVLELRDELPTHFRFMPRKNERLPASVTRFTTTNGRRPFECVCTVLGPNEGRRMTFRNEFFVLDEGRLGYRWSKGQTAPLADRRTMLGSTGFWCVFPPVAEYREHEQPRLRDLARIDVTHGHVRYEVRNLPDADPRFDVNKWDFVYDFNVIGFGEIIIALAGDMKAPNRDVASRQTDPADPAPVSDRFGNRFRLESHSPQVCGGHFYLVRQIDAHGQVIDRPERIPDRVDILPVIRHVMASAFRADDDPTNDRDADEWPERYRLGPMLIGSEVWDQTQGVLTMDRDVDLECVAK